MILLDTTFLIDLLRKKENAIEKAVELIKRDKLATTYINIYELLFGVYSLSGADYKQKLESVSKLIDKLELLSLDKHSAIISAKIGGDLSLKGQMIGDTDCMIAGISLANGITTIITRNAEHFGRIKGLKIETY
ncbi:MAG: type II toxin-antitoxin system VapC family toxin [Nanoarchaeota archaeon]